MPSPEVPSVDDYIARQPAPVQDVLARVRAAIRKALPAAEETISYGIPAYRVNGTVVLYFAGWKKHWSLYPAGEDLVAAFAAELEPYEISRGTIRFPLAGRVPVGLITRIAKFRAREIRWSGGG